MSLRGEDEEDGAESPELSCVSLESDHSKGYPPEFGQEPLTLRTRGERKKAGSPELSCVSVKSDHSKGYPPEFSHEPFTPETRGKREKAESPELSCLSLKSDHSKGYPPEFSHEPRSPSGTGLTPGRRMRLHRQDEEDRTKLPVSLRSDHSKGYPPEFSHEPRSPSGTGLTPGQNMVVRGQEEDRAMSPELSGVSLKSDHSKGYPPEFSREPLSPEKWAAQLTLQLRIEGLQRLQEQHKIHLEKRYERVSEGDEAGRQTLLERIYTELRITEGHSHVVNLETTVNRSPDGRSISCNDLFKAIRVVLTTGVAGVGKTLSIQKFILDWAKGLENPDLHLVVPLSFRELNLVKEQQYSLLELLRVFHPTLEKLRAEQVEVCKVLFILDGLEESRLALDFEANQIVTDVTQNKSVSVLLTNLIKGNLLPSAQVWITSSPAAANQIPPSCVDRMTEVQGFTDDQKEEYFRRRFKDNEGVSSRIISHIKASTSLHIMCKIPVFCWITATVLESILSSEQRAELPKTLTNMYSHFLLVQTKRKQQKYGGGQQELTEADRELLLKLGRLAFEHLERGNQIFYSEDLEKCGLSVTEASMYSGVCTEIFRRESVIFQKSMYSFLFPSIQQFLAAVYSFHCHTNKKKAGDVPHDRSLDVFLNRVTKKSMECQNGHLDLFVRFLHGLSLESNQELLGGLLGCTDNRPETIKKVIKNLKKMNTGDISPDRSINIFYCLLEMKDQSVHQEVKEFLKSEKKLSTTQRSALVYMLQMSEEGREEEQDSRGAE